MRDGTPGHPSKEDFKPDPPQISPESAFTQTDTGNAPRQEFPMALVFPPPLGHSCHILQWKSCDRLHCARPGSPSTVASSITANGPPSPPRTSHHSSRGRCNEVNDCRWLQHRWSQEETSGPSCWHLAWSSASSRAWAHQQVKTLPAASS